MIDFNALTGGPDFGAPTPVNFDAMGILDDLARDRDEQAAILKRRGPYLVAARQVGHPWEAIADAAGLSRQATIAAATRANDGVLPKREIQEA